MNKRLKDKKLLSGMIVTGGFLIILAGGALTQQTALGQSYIIVPSIKNHCQLNTFFCKVHRHNFDFHHVTDADHFHRVADKFLVCQL